MIERVPADLFHLPHPFVPFLCLCVSFSFSLFIWLFDTFLALSTRCSLSLQITSCLYSVFFNYLCCTPFNLSRPIFFFLIWCPSRLLSSLFVLPQKNKNGFSILHRGSKQLIFELPCLLNVWSGQHEMELLHPFKNPILLFFLLIVSYRHGCIIYVMYKPWTDLSSLHAGVSDQVDLQYHDQLETVGV